MTDRAQMLRKYQLMAESSVLAIGGAIYAAWAVGYLGFELSIMTIAMTVAVLTFWGGGSHG